MTCCLGYTDQRESGPHIGEYCSGCGKWIRWIPQKTFWKDFVMPFGKYTGEKLGDIYLSDPEYIKWCAEKLKKSSVQRKCKEAIQ